MANLPDIDADAVGGQKARPYEIGAVLQAVAITLQLRGGV